MPQLDGGGLVRRLREWNVPVILLTGDPNRGRTPGAVYVPKPFDRDHPLTVVGRLLAEPEGQPRDHSALVGGPDNTDPG